MDRLSALANRNPSYQSKYQEALMDFVQYCNFNLVFLTSHFWPSYSKGEPLVKRAIQILKKTCGTENSRIADAMQIYAALLKDMNRKGEAQELEAQAKKIQHKLKKKPTK